MFDKFAKWFTYFGMPAVLAYHLICGNVFLNTAAEDAAGLEKVGNLILSPVQYLLAGKKAILIDGKYRLEQHYNYNVNLTMRSIASVLSLPVALPLGSFMKGIGYISEETRLRAAKIVAAAESTEVAPNLAYYRTLGIPIDEEADLLVPQGFQRRPGDENNLRLEKELLRNIVQIFKENKIPFWVDCGTCIGAYRYGGAIPWDEDIDVAVLLPDFDNVVHALNALDKTKYCVEDWSNRCQPKTYMRIYIRENRNYIDIYHFDIDPEKKSICFILANADSAFMVDSWKIREGRFVVPSAYETIFPLRKANFDGIEVYVPNQTKKYIQERYGENTDPVRIYNEITGEYEKDLNHPYWKLPYTSL